MTIKKGILKNFNQNTYLADVRIAGSQKAYLEGIKVARNLPASEMLAGRQVATVFFEESNPVEAVIIAVYG